MPDRFLDVPDARLAFDVRPGAGPVVVGLHGLTSSRAAEDAGGFFGWPAVAAAGRTLVRYDARAHGGSTGRPDARDHRWPVLADDLLALLDVVSPARPVDAVGVSMGTGTLLHAAVLRPERFRRLVLVIPPTVWGTRAAQQTVYAGGAQFVRERGLDAFVRASAALPQLPILAAGNRPSVPPDVAEALLPSVLEGAAASDLPAEEAVSRLRHPVLLRPWTDDPGHPVSSAERLAALLPDARLEVMRTAEDLAALDARVAAFLGDAADGSASQHTSRPHTSRPRTSRPPAS